MRRLLAHAEARLPYYRPAELCALLATLAALKFRPAGRITQRLLQKARGKLAALRVRNTPPLDLHALDMFNVL